MNKQKIIISMAIFFTFFFCLTPQISSADVLLPGDINTCGELAVPGVYNLTSSVSNGTSTCFNISSDNVIINGGGYTVSGSGSIAIDARQRDGGPSSSLTEGANGYTNLIINELIITGYTTGVNLSGNSDVTGLGENNGNGGDGGDVAVFYSSVGGITTAGGNSSSKQYGGIGGNIDLTSYDLNISSSTISTLAGTGTVGRNTDGGLDLNYTNSLNKTNVTLSSLSFFNDNATNYGVYIGGTWPIFPGTVSSCGTLFGSGLFTLSQNITNVSGTCFVAGSNNIIFDGAGYSITSATTSNLNYFTDASGYSNFTLASTTAVNFSNLIKSSSTITISGGALNLTGKKINSPNILISAESLTVASTTFSTSMLNISYAVSIAGTSTATTTADINSLIVNNLDFGLRLRLNPLFGEVWISRLSAESRQWKSIASSVDGVKLIALASAGYIYGSIDSGVTWTQRTSDITRVWESVAMSADGRKVAALGSNTNIYVSTDGGFTWATYVADGIKSWNSIAMSADGKKILASASNNYLYVSLDGGVTWTSRMNDANRGWLTTTVSADGGVMFAGTGSAGYIYRSTDGGNTWATSTGSLALGTKDWKSIAISADGLKVVAAAGTGYLYTSIDGGVNFTPRVNDANRAWRSVTSSINGNVLTSVVNSGKIYTSTDSGVSWTAQDSNRVWFGVTSSGDGNRMAAAVLNGYIYTSSKFPSVYSVDIVTPFASSSVIDWNPVISWGTSKYCYYSYDNFISTSTANCALSGSDIPPPQSGNYTLYVKGISAMREVITKSVNFTNDGNKNIQVNLPELNKSYEALIWFPDIDYSVNNESLVTCQYSYDNFISTSTVNCLNGGSDILPPSNDGQNILYIRTVDSNNNVNIKNVPFTYLYSFVKNTALGLRGWSGYDSFALSYDGTKILANMINDYIWTSSNGGTSWVQRTSDVKRSWAVAASSDDGVKLVSAVSNNGLIYTSVDSGATWVPRGTTTRSWFRVTSSSDGVNLAASVFGGYIYTSTDSGVTWVQRTSAGSKYWYGLASSNDGMKLIASGNTSGQTGYVYISTDGGANWATSTALGYKDWKAVASSGDGSRLVAVASTNFIYVSTDGGVTWNSRVNDVARAWYSVSASDDGMTLAAATFDGYIYVSKDGGNNWEPRSSTGLGDWFNIEVSGDGKKILAARSDDDKHLYILDLNANDKFLNSYITINRPIASSYLTNLIWSPSITWGFKKTNCQYSYNNWVSTSTANCAMNGTDISLPPSNGSVTLSLRSTDDNSNVSIGSVIFNYILNGWTLVSGVSDADLDSTAVSIDGDKMFTGGSYIYRSIDSGINWIRTNAPMASYGWNVVSTADGTKLVASQGDIVTKIYFSTDSGLNWTQSSNSGTGGWYGLASSADGSRMIVAKNNSYLYISEDYGNTWTSQLSVPIRAWRDFALSANGLKAAGVVNSGYIYLSADGGATWATSTGSLSLGTKAWIDITASSDATKLAAIAGSYIYLSSDSGVTWATSTAGLKSWKDLTMSADGNKITAAVFTGHIYTSEDGGVTWAQSTSDPTREYLGVSSSADGNRVVAVARPDIFVLVKNPLVISPSIFLPQNLSTTTAWRPIISWSTATSCYYSYDNFVSTSTADCALDGADIIPPAVSGSVTLSIKGVDAGGVISTKTSSFTYSPHYWCGTADSNWSNVSNWFTDASCSVNKGSLPVGSSGVFLVGNTSPVISWSTTTLPLFIDSTGLTAGANASGVIFSNSTNNTTKIIGNATFNSGAYNSGIITGNVIYSDAVAGTFNLSNSMKWAGSIGGTIKGGDGIDIIHLIFNDLSSNEITIGNTFSVVFNDGASNNGIINGSAVFNNTKLFTIGTVNGTATLNGLSQTLNGVNNVINLVKNVAVAIRDTLFLTSGSVLNISGSTTLLGYDADNLLTIKSTVPGIQASIGINGTSTLNYLRIKDLNNTGPSINVSSSTIFNDEGNTGFVFNSDKYLIPRDGMTSRYLQGGIPVFPGLISHCGNLYFAGTYTLEADIAENCNILGSGVIINGAGHAITGNIIGNQYGFTIASTTVSGSVTSSGTTTVNDLTSITGDTTIAGLLMGDGTASISNITIQQTGIVATSSVNFVGNVSNSGVMHGGISIAGNTLNNGIINGDSVLRASSTNHGVINGNVVLNNYSINSGTINGSTTANDSSFSSGTTTGNLTLNNIIALNGKVTFSTSTSFLGTGRVLGLVKDRVGATITTWKFNDQSSNIGYTKGIGYFNDTSVNSGTILGRTYFNGRAVNSGTVIGNADVYRFVVAPLTGIVTGTITYHSYPNGRSFINSTGDGMWDNPANWFEDATLTDNLGSVPAGDDFVILFSSTTIAHDIGNDIYIGSNDITIDGVSGNEIDGFISGNGAYDGGDAYDFNLTNLTVTGTTSADGADNSNGIGGDGGNIHISTSTTANITASGGDGTLGGGDGGTITVINSVATSTAPNSQATGGQATYCGPGGNSGGVSSINSSYGTIINNAGNGTNTGCPSENHSGGSYIGQSIIGTYSPVVSNPTPSAPSNSNNNAGASAGAGSSGSTITNNGLNNNLNLSNLEKLVRDTDANFGISRFVNPLAGLARLRPIGFKTVPKFRIKDNVEKFLNDSLPKELVDLSEAVPSIKKELSSAGIINGFALYSMENSPINTPTLNQIIKTKTLQPLNLLFVSVDGIETPTKLSIDAKGGLYQIINVNPYSVLAVSARHIDKKVAVTFNGKNVKYSKDKNNVVKVDVAVPKGGSVHVLKIGNLLLEVRSSDFLYRTDNSYYRNITSIEEPFWWFKENVNNFIKAIRR
jgi:photosystem II stability/assembly factor-like uncharacterized protein